MVVPQGDFELHRHPERPRSTLRAWDAADAYALRWLAEKQEPSGPVAIVNEGFGALATALHKTGPVVVSDSASSHTGIAANLARNGLAQVTVGTEIAEVPADLALVVIKVPRSLGQLEEQLQLLRPHLTPKTVVLGAGMVKQIHTSTLQLFETILGPTTTSLAERKARLIHCTVDRRLTPIENPWPMTWRSHGIAVVNRGGVFSAQSLDIGARFLLGNLPETSGEHVVDLGCGNGVLGAVLAMTDPAASLSFIDASARAVDSARGTWAANHEDRPAAFHLADRMINVTERQSVDLVLNNPPFHDERAIGDATAWDMFVDSYTVLKPGGELRVVANRQLGHHARLKKIFGNCETVASNRKFVVLSAMRSTDQSGPTR